MDPRAALAALTAEGTSLEAKAAAAKVVADYAARDRLQCALLGALPIVSAAYQTAPPDSKLEEAGVAALNALLTKDETLPFFISNLISFLKGAAEHEGANGTGGGSGSLHGGPGGNDGDRERARNAARALGILNQRIYHPDESTRQALLSALPSLTAILNDSSDETLVCAVARILGGFGEASNPQHRMTVALSGALPRLAAIYQSSEVESDLEAAALSALNKLVLYNGDEKDRGRFVKSVVAEFGATKSRSGLTAALGALSVLNLKIYGADDHTHSTVIGALDKVLALVSDGTTPQRTCAAKVLEGFADASLSHHFRMFTAGVPGVLVDIANEEDGSDKAVRDSCAASITRMVHDVDIDRKDHLLKMIIDLWQSSSATALELHSAARFVYDLANKQNATWDRVAKIFPTLIQAATTGESLRRRAAVIMLHKMAMIDEISRRQAVHLGCVKPVVKMLEKGSIEDQEIAGYCLVTLACGRIGASELVEHIELFVKRSKARSTRKLEIGMTSVLGNLATWCDRLGRRKMINAGAVTVLLPVMRSKDPTRHAVVAALAIGNLVGADEAGLLEGDDGLVRMVLAALKATAAGEDYQEISFESWAPAMCLMNLSINDKNKRYIAKASGLSALMPLLKTGDFETQQYAARTIWNVAFTENVEQQVPQIAHTLRDLEGNSPDPEVRAACEGALFQLAQHNKSSSAKSEKSFLMHHRKSQKDFASAASSLRSFRSDRTNTLMSEADIAAGHGHIMLSYQWVQQPRLLWLADQLEREGYRIWLDVHNMSVNTLDSKTKAVEQSLAVIVCMSQAYRESETCRTEAEYAYRLKKTIVPVLVQPQYSPDGWLGSLVGAQDVVDFSGKEEQHWSDVVRQLVAALGNTGRDEKPANGAAGAPRSRPVSAISTSKMESRVRDAEERAKRAETKARLLEQRLSAKHDRAKANTAPIPINLTSSFRSPPPAVTQLTTPPNMRLVPASVRVNGKRASVAFTPEDILPSGYDNVSAAADAGTLAEIQRRLDRLDRKLDSLLDRPAPKGCCTIS